MFHFTRPFRSGGRVLKSEEPRRLTDTQMLKNATLDRHLSHGPNSSFLPIYRWNSLCSVLSCCILSSSWSWSMHTGHRETAYIYGTSRFAGWSIRPFWLRSIVWRTYVSGPPIEGVTLSHAQEKSRAIKLSDSSDQIYHVYKAVELVIIDLERWLSILSNIEGMLSLLITASLACPFWIWCRFQPKAVIG